MAVLPLVQRYEELRLTVASAEMVLPSLDMDDEIILSCDISSLPTHNCNVVFRRSQDKDKNKLTGSGKTTNTKKNRRKQLDLFVNTFHMKRFL